MNAGLALPLVLFAVTCSACGSVSPLAPGEGAASPAPPADSARLSGWVYMRSGSEDPPIADAAIQLSTSGGNVSILTDAYGRYELVLPRGTVSITASKEGYESTTWELKLLEDTVLNFGLVRK